MDATNAYGKYRRTRDAAWQCLLDCQVCRLPVQVSAIAAAMQVAVCAYEANAGLLRRRGYGPLLEAAGFAYADPAGSMIIFYDSRASRQQIRFTIAHELGHILLGHLGLRQPVGQPLLPSQPTLEQEADRFAARLLAPACALWGLSAYSAGAIAALCDITPELAEARAERMRVLLARDAWLTSPLERRLYQQLGFSVPGEA